MDLAFEQMLAEHNQAFKEADVFSNWMPPDNDYIVSLVKLDKGMKVQKDGATTSWWKLIGRIEVEQTCPQDVQQADKLAGKEFSVGYYTSKAYGILKGDARILSKNPQLDDLPEAHAVLEASIGHVVRVTVSTSYSTKHQKNFTNCDIKEVINTTAASAVEPAGAEIQPAGVYVTPEEAAAQAATPAEIPAPIDDGNVAVANGTAEIPVGVPAEAPPVA